MRIISFVFLMIFITSCDPPYTEDNSHLPNKQLLANEVRNQTIVQLKKEKDLYPCGVGSRMMDQIKMLSLGFDYYKEIDINQARELLIRVGKLFLNTINANEHIRSYLQNYPFRPENIQIRIFLRKSDGSEPEFDKLTIISLIDGVLRYKVKSSESELLSTIYEETFEEAAAKLSNTETLNSSMAK